METSADHEVMRVLVVDDYLDTGESLCLLLRLWGYEAHQAADGITALEIEGWFRPHVVFLDLILQGIDGLEVARRLRQRRQSATPFVLCLTGYSDADVVSRCLEAGCHLHLPKPAEPARLRALLQAWDAARPRRPNPDRVNHDAHVRG